MKNAVNFLEELGALRTMRPVPNGGARARRFTLESPRHQCLRRLRESVPSRTTPIISSNRRMTIPET